MSFRELLLKKSYDSDTDDITIDFYVPALSVSIQYSRLTGFFSSTSLAVAAKGISGLIRNGGTIRLVTGVVFRKEDIEAIKDAIEDPEKIIENAMLRGLDDTQDDFVRDHVRALGWMVAKQRLKIKAAIVLGSNNFPLDRNGAERQGIFHQKVGILEDLEGNMVSFSGSENETASGWCGNIEEFKVFRSWDPGEKDYFESDLLKFNKFWEGKTRRTRIIELPKAIEERLIQMAPDDIEDLELDKWTQRKTLSTAFQLRKYQQEAVRMWLDNDKEGILEMATGTGKTVTALNSLQKTLEKESSMITIVSSPFIHLSEQWIRELEKLGIKSDKLIADSSRPRWKDQLVDNLLDVENRISEKLLVFTTHNTFSSHDFMNIVKKCKKRSPKMKFLLIVDEVHGIGAPERRRGLIEEYDYRLGLSATPKRWFDLKGTDKIFSYFGDVVYRFTLKDAIDTGYLTPYIYRPHFTFLTLEEMERYEAETRKISKAYHRSKDECEKDEIFTLLCIRRQKIIRNASNKLIVFRSILDGLGKVRHCLVYCSPQQIRTVQNILNQKNIIQHKFTQSEGTRNEDRYGGISERDFLIQQFSDGTYHALVSMKCLDEGVDVPPARLAIMLDNSGNPREYIQRRGRVLRKFPGKENAVIHDIIVEPIVSQTTPRELKDLEKKIISKELARYRDFASSAQNASECLKMMKDVEKKYGV